MVENLEKLNQGPMPPFAQKGAKVCDQRRRGLTLRCIQKISFK